MWATHDRISVSLITVGLKMKSTKNGFVSVTKRTMLKMEECLQKQRNVWNIHEKISIRVSIRFSDLEPTTINKDD